MHFGHGEGFVTPVPLASPSSPPAASTVGAMTASLLLPNWSAYEEKGQPVMVFMTDAEGGSQTIDHMREPQCEFWSGVPEDSTPIN
jgi:hypothetical protein